MFSRGIGGKKDDIGRRRLSFSENGAPAQIEEETDQTQVSEVEKEAPVEEGPAKSDEASSAFPDMEKSCMYLVEEDRPQKCYELFADTLAHGLPGLCATRVYPEILKQRFDFPNCVVLWLSNAGKEDSVRPRDLERLSLLLEQFFSNRKGVVLIDGIEYLITNNDFVTVLRLVQSLRDLVAMNLAIMIVSLNPSTLGFQELNLLEREMDSVLRMNSPDRSGQQDFQGR